MSAHNNGTVFYCHNLMIYMTIIINLYAIVK